MTDKKYFDACYKEACEITAYICKMYGIDPHANVKVGKISVPTILCHWDSYKLGMGCGHSDVYPWFNKFWKTMEDVRNDVAALLKGADDMTTDEVRKIVSEELAKAGGVTHAEMDSTHLYMQRCIEKALADLGDKVSMEITQNLEKRYERLEDVPEWYRDTIHKLMNRNVLKGTGEPGVIDVTDDFCRIATVLDRAGAFS